MSFEIPERYSKWVLGNNTGFEDMKLEQDVTLSSPSDGEVLVKMHAASLNYRDLIIAKGQYGGKKSPDLVPGSDGSGEVVAVGKSVTRFKKGDKVLTLFNQRHIGGPPNPDNAASGLGGNLNGVLRQYGAFHENGLVLMPSSLSYEEGATLPCAALTAWNALYGLKPLKPGDTVLTQGTGGVSIFALQFAKAAGATVIATTSSKEKEGVLKKLGADHVLNYKEDSAWGSTAKQLSIAGEGIDHIIDVGGPKTIQHSFDAIRMDGVISIIGFLGGRKGEDEPSSLECLPKQCIMRGLLVGSRAQFEEMNRAIETHKIKPVIDEKIFKFNEVLEAYQYQWDQKHFGKLVVKME